jgi:AraC-like DNA-binding protein
VEGRTIENFFIEQRIEKAKELIFYGQLTLSEIAFELDYKSSAYLSSQFKKVTGNTPSYFKELGVAKRMTPSKV